MKRLLLVCMILFIIPFATALRAPPALPVVIDGTITINNQTSNSTHSIILSDNGTIVDNNVTNIQGIYHHILDQMDNPLTYNDDPTCAINDPCVPCQQGIGPDRCIEGYAHASHPFTMQVDNSTATITHNLAGPVSFQPFIAYADADGDGYVYGEDCNDNDDTIYPGAPELCDNKDNNCNMIVDENIADQHNGSDVGACQPEITSCQNGTWVIIQDQILPTEEVCDNIDNDCDGDIDNDLVRLTTNQNGLCQGNTEYCEAGTWSQNTSNHIPTEEVCDGLDSDCDAVLDGSESIPNESCGQGNCAGTRTCLDTGWSNCSSHNDICGAYDCDTFDTACQDYVDQDLYCDADGVCPTTTSCEEVIFDDGTTICNNETTYTCDPDDSTLGADLMTKQVYTYCGDNTGACDGAVDDTASWTLLQECAALQYCVADTAICIDSGLECIEDPECGDMTETAFCDGDILKNEIITPACTDNMCNTQTNIEIINDTCDVCTDATCVVHPRISGCTVIDQTGTYLLDNNITFSDDAASSCIHVSANDVILDCQQNMIKSSTNSPAVLVTAENVTTTRCMIDSADGRKEGVGIRYDQVSSGMIVGNTVASRVYGIQVRDSSNVVVSQNTATVNSFKGIYVDTSTGITLAENDIRYSYHGFAVEHADDNTFNDNYIYGCAAGVRTADGSTGNAFYGNEFISNSFGTFFYTGSDDIVFEDNLVDQSGKYGIYLIASSNAQIRNNVANNSNQFGIVLSRSSNNMVENNIADNNNAINTAHPTYPGAGIYLSSSSNNNQVIGNSASNNKWNFYIHSSNENTYENNIATDAIEYDLKCSSASGNAGDTNTFPTTDDCDDGWPSQSPSVASVQAVSEQPVLEEDSLASMES